MTILFFPFSSVIHAEDKTEQSSSVAIIGGGMTGVAAATFLRDASTQVHLFEKHRELGGHATTKWLDNGHGQYVQVDLGAQNFCKGPWDAYIEFLKFYNYYHKDDLYTFTPSGTISKSGQDPHFITPNFLDFSKLKFLPLHSKWRTLHSIYRLQKSAHQHYLINDKDYSKTLGEFIEEMNVARKDVDETLLPFIASTLAVDIGQCKKLSSLAFFQLVAFDKPLKITKMKVFKEGMGNVIEKVGRKLEATSKNIHINRNASVYEISRKGSQFLIKYNRNGIVEEVLVDKIITTSQAPHVASYLKHLFPQDDSLLSHLQKLEYVDTRVVLHRSNRFSKGSLSSFVNIEYNEKGHTFLTMNLGKINKAHYGNICKTWVNDADVYKGMKEKGEVLAEEIFQHPFITPEFVDHRDAIDRLLEDDNRYKDISIAGGWMEIPPTQSTTIISAYKSVKRLFPETMEEKKWEECMPSLIK